MALQTKNISAKGAKGNHNFTLTVTENSTNQSGNNSAASWEFKLSAINTGFNWTDLNSGKIAYTVTLNGTEYSGVITDYDGKSTVTLKSGSATWTHNNDGTKTVSLSFSVTDGYGYKFTPGNASASGTMTLTAITRNFTITFDPNGGSLLNPGGNLNNGTNTNSVQVTYGSGNYWNMSTDIPTRTGYDFVGWFTAKTGGAQVYGADGKCILGTSYWDSEHKWIGTANLNVYAQWKAKTFKLIFDANGGKNTKGKNFTLTDYDVGYGEKESYVTVTYDKGSFNDMSTDIPTRDGYTFTGWFTAKTGGDQVYGADGYCEEGDYWVENGNSYKWAGTSNLTVYAQWQSDTYIHNGTKPVPHACYIHNGTDFVKHIPYIHDGTDWVPL